MKRIRTTKPDLSSSGDMVTEVSFGSPPPMILNFRDSVLKQEGENGQSIKFSEHVKERLYRPWQTSIIIKLMVILSGSPLTINEASSSIKPQIDPYEAKNTLIRPWSLVQNRKGKKPFKASVDSKAKKIAPKKNEVQDERGAYPSGSRFEALENSNNRVEAHVSIGNEVIEEVTQMQTEPKNGSTKPSKSKGQNKSKGKSRQALGDISNDGVVKNTQIGFENNISSASTTKVGFDARSDSKRKLKGVASEKSIGFQVRSINFQEATLADVVASLKSKLSLNSGKFIPPILPGVEPPDPGPSEDKMDDIPGDEMDDDHGDNSAPYIHLDVARLKKLC
ncbi:hypothetical protein GBA52_003792 [Prunus armeniaca]|nr:hypothetical protein GBA52_003792 [Prunus armeniaca]